MKVFCKAKQHWEIVDGKLVLGAESNEILATLLMKMTARLEAEIRTSIYDEIIALDFEKDRKKIVKYGIENAALQVQDICATIALGKVNND